jgi:hypothetical protein
VLLARIEEQLGALRRVDERARGVEVFEKNGSASFPCTCTGTPSGQALPN